VTQSQQISLKLSEEMKNKEIYFYFYGTNKTLKQLLEDENYQVKFTIDRDKLCVAIRRTLYSSWGMKNREDVTLYNIFGNPVQYKYKNFHRCISYETARSKFPEYWY
jgi:hypothetical protein